MRCTVGMEGKMIKQSVIIKITNVEKQHCNNNMENANMGGHGVGCRLMESAWCSSPFIVLTSDLMCDGSMQEQLHRPHAGM